MAEIIITNFAKQQLQQIYDYIAWKTSDDVAMSEIQRIVKYIEFLEITPKIGRTVEELKSLKLNHRQLVVSNYKIIYRIEKDTVYITDVFDCRQHPDKILKRNT